MTLPRIALFGLFGSTNLGNEATLAAFLHHWRRRFPGARVLCVGPRDSVVSKTFGIELIDMEPIPVRRHFWRFRTPLARSLSFWAHRITEPVRAQRAWQQIHSFDLVLIPGTGILDDFGQTAFDLPHHLLRWCRAAQRASVPVYFVSVGAEPVSGGLTRRLFKQATETSAYRSYRDDESRRNAARLGVSTTSDPVYPDLAFSLPGEALAGTRPVAWPPRRIGIGVMGYYGWNKSGAEGEEVYRVYLAKLKRFVDWLLQRGYSVRLLVGDTEYDHRPVRELAAEFNGANGGESAARVTAQPINSVDDLLRQIAETDLVVATRLHNVLLALLLERPTISISYSRKNDVLLQEFGLGSYCQDIDVLDVNRLIGQFTDLAARPEPPVAAIRAMNEVYRLRLDEQYERIFSGLRSA